MLYAIRLFLLLAAGQGVYLPSRGQLPLSVTSLSPISLSFANPPNQEPPRAEDLLLDRCLSKVETDFAFVDIVPSARQILKAEKVPVWNRMVQQASIAGTRGGGGIIPQSSCA